MLARLPEDVHAQVTALSAAGDDQVCLGNYDAAIDSYEDALALLPGPTTQWDAATWLLTAIGDTHFLKRDFAAARTALQDAMHAPGAIGNPFVHLRLGQAQFELGDMNRAKDELVRAYMGAGERIFEGEDPKFLNLVKATIRPPASP